jgi:hypothetical protein
VLHLKLEPKLVGKKIFVNNGKQTAIGHIGEERLPLQILVSDELGVSHYRFVIINRGSSTCCAAYPLSGLFRYTTRYALPKQISPVDPDHFLESTKFFKKCLVFKC